MKLRKAAAVILAMLMVLSALPASWADSLLPCRHQWSSWKTVTEATCASAGKQERTCGICHEKQTRTTGALGHNYGPWEVTKEPTCEEAGEQAHVCAACGRRETREIPALGHEWDDGVVTREPTAAQPGIITYTCVRDRSHIKEKLIPLGLNPGASALPDIVIICDYDGHTVYPGDELTVHYTIFNTGKHDLKWVSDTFEGDLKDMLAPDESFTWEEKYQITEQMIYDCIYFDPSAEEYITQWTEGSIPVCVFGGTAEYLAGDLPDGENKASAGYALNDDLCGFIN